MQREEEDAEVNGEERYREWHEWTNLKTRRSLGTS